MSGYYNQGGVPSLGNERLLCVTCSAESGQVERTIHKWGRCIHCGTKLASGSYRKPPPMRQTRAPTVPKRLTDPVTGLERKG